jgi:separase
MPSTTSLGEVVRKAIATPSSCPPTTPATLQSLLAPTQDVLPKPPKTPAKTTTTRKPPPTRNTRAKAAPSAVVEATLTLTVQERYKLATDVVNVSLKVLNDATKTSAPSPSQSPTTKKPAQSGLTAVAECARIAFAHLRSARSANDESLQLETGMLALSSKLVALGMDMLAMKELRILKTCIHRRSEGTSLTSSSEKETLATLLYLECNTADVKVLSLAISYHMTVLRLVVNSGRPATIEATLPHVSLDNPISAAALVLRSVELSEDKTKAAKQLDTLSKLVLSMCPSPSSTADHTSHPQTHTSPDIAFRLQTTALLIQTKWWPLAGHKANFQKEIHEPLVRYIDAYRRRAQDQGPLAYKQAIECVSILVELDKLENSFSTPSTALYKSLSALAESFGLQDEALRYNEIMSSASNKVSGSDMSLHFTIRSMALCLNRDNHLDLTMLRGQISSCKTQLGDNLTLPASSVDEMLIELAKLRKTTTKLLTQESKIQSGSVLDERGLVLCTISFLCTEILLWCLQRVTGGESSGSVGSRLLVSFVSSSILSCRLLVTSCDHVATVHNALETCTRLLDVKPDPEAEHLVVNISNLHWRCFQLSASSTGESSPQALLSLQASVDVLRERASVLSSANQSRFSSALVSCAN